MSDERPDRTELVNVYYSTPIEIPASPDYPSKVKAATGTVHYRDARPEAEDPIRPGELNVGKAKTFTAPILVFSTEPTGRVPVVRDPLPETPSEKWNAASFQDA